MLIGSKKDQRILLTNYYELLLIGYLKPSIFLRKSETKHNDNACKPVENFREQFKKKEIKKLLHHAAIKGSNMNTVGVAYCVAFLIARAGKPPTVRKEAYYEQGRK